MPVLADLAGKPLHRGLRLDWWRDARFGMFVHWDVSSILGTEIGWSRGATKPLDITGDPAGYVADPLYDELYHRFDPTRFDAREWVRLAETAGMKYLVFTAKHHAGFCMWDTKLTDYSIMHSPFQRDVVKELSDACRESRMPFGIYYSQRDWHHSDYGFGDNQKYLAYMNGQLHELLTQYGKIDLLWFDSYGKGDLEKFWVIEETWLLIKSLQPEIIVNNRLAVLAAYNEQPTRYLGDFDTPEQKLGTFQNDRAWESCICVLDAPGGGWSYRSDGKAKSFEECLKILISCATGDGNLLLDVGPDSQGVIPDDQAEPLLQMGAWLKEYGESIYATRGGPYQNGSWGGSTFRDNFVYLHLIEWSGGKINLPPLQAKILHARCLNTLAGIVQVEQTSSIVSLVLTSNGVSAVDTIIVLQLSAHASQEMVNDKPLTL